MPRMAHASYLAAMIDGEGCVSVVRRRDKVVNRMISIVNTEESIITACADACDALGIAWGISERDRSDGRKHQWVLYICGRENLLLVKAKVPLRSNLKIARLDDALESYVYV